MITEQTSFLLAATLVVASSFINHLNNRTMENTKSKGTILLIASSSNTLQLKEGKSVPTGYFLDELAVPAQAFVAEGYDIVVATPEGNVPAMDAHSNHPALFQNDEAKLKKALDFVHTYPAMLHPVSLADVVKGGLDKYVALYVPGGHAPMVDLMQDKNLGIILNYFHEKSKPTAFLCHGPIAALSALPDAPAYNQALINNDTKAVQDLGKNWIYSGYRMTIYSNEEEYGIEKDILKGHLQFYVADALKSAGGKVERSGENDKPLVVHDRELITGQNPASDHWIAEELLKTLKENKSHH
jgi:putative intracellular protease/amidase